MSKPIIPVLPAKGTSVALWSCCVTWKAAALETSPSITGYNALIAGAIPVSHRCLRSVSDVLCMLSPTLESIEHLFYYEVMGMARAAEVLRLQNEISKMQRASARVTALPVAEALSRLFPDGGLRPGSAYAIDSSLSLLAALLSEPSQAGSWCAVVGIPEFSSEAAERAGVDLARFALVPDPGARWLSIVSAVAEVFPVVAVRPSSRVSDGDLSRLSARLRDRGGVLLTMGPWSQSETMLRLERPVWRGIEQGHGILTAREVTITSAGRRVPQPRHVRVLMPGPLGQAVSAIAMGGNATEHSTTRPLSTALPGSRSPRTQLRAVPA